MDYKLTNMQWVIATLAQAQAIGLDIEDLLLCAEHAKTIEAWNNAVNLLDNMTPEDFLGEATND